VPKKILVIEDEKDIQEILQIYLKRDGYDVHFAGDGETGLRKASQERYDLILLDLMLPRMDGLEICRNLRSRPQTSDIPIIIVTAKVEESDRVVGLEMGADDYITKPFSPREVVARVRALFRRLEKPKTKEVRHEFGGIVLDPSKHEVTYEGKSLSLTAKEFKLLEYFLANRGRVLSRDILLNEIWGYDYFGTTRTVDVHVAHLRQRFQVLNKSLVSIKGLGYKLQEEPTKP
jgi:DNA-binding response OmpR family regulator